MATRLALSLSGAQNHRCAYCKHKMVTWRVRPGTSPARNHMSQDHFLAATYGGTKDADNIIMACIQCNCLRKHLDARVFDCLMQRWFQRDPTLQARWHSITHTEIARFNREILYYQELHLRHKSKTSGEEFKQRHETFLQHYAHKLQQRRQIWIGAFA